MPEFFNQLKVVALSPYALVAYIVVVLAWLVLGLRVKRNKQVLRHLKSLPASDRLEALRLEMGVVLPKDITPEQWLKSRVHIYYLLAFAILCLVSVVIFVTAYARPEKPTQIIVTVRTSEIGHAFNDDIHIRVDQITPENSSTKYKVSATVMSSGHTWRIEDKEIGFTGTYTGTNTYRVQILEVNEPFAKFSITKE